MNKKKLVSMMLAGIMVIGIVGTNIDMAYADTSANPVTGEASSKTPGQVYEDKDATEYSGYITDKSEGFTLDVTADTVGNSRDIIYSVKIISGRFKYTYDYGKGWNPNTHSYTDTTNGGVATEPGWSDDDFTESNCELTVQNDSNYPVNVVATYNMAADAFNAGNPSDGVVGLFAKKVSHLKAIKKEGIGGNWTISSDTAETSEDFDLGVVNPPSGNYWVITSNDTLSNKATYYFAFSGAPDAGKNISADDPVEGTIRLDIKPVSLANVTKKP